MADLVALTGESLGRVRRFFDENMLVGTRRDGTFKVPSVFLVDGEPLSSLRGTVFVLHDAGFTDDEVIDWLLSPDDSIGLAPIEALLAGRKSEVRRVAASLA
ncbi:MAG TPA: Rv2175c family DNA-binding protein [Microbacterium sp.]|nr:Rv2175c family DNA-binding protein [Microbacterium sp.]